MSAIAKGVLYTRALRSPCCVGEIRNPLSLILRLTFQCIETKQVTRDAGCFGSGRENAEKRKRNDWRVEQLWSSLPERGPGSRPWSR